MEMFDRTSEQSMAVRPSDLTQQLSDDGLDGAVQAAWSLLQLPHHDG